MADTTYGVARPNWATTPGIESVTSNMDFITITTGVDLRQTATPASTTASCSATASTTLTLGSANTSITVGMIVTGTGITPPANGSPLMVVAITDSTHVVVNYAQVSLTSATLTFTANGIAAFNKLIEIVSERGQPVIMGSIGFTSGVSTIYMALEHMGWSVMGGGTTPVLPTTAGTGLRLIDRIVTDGINFGWTPTGDTNLTVIFNTVLT